MIQAETKLSDSLKFIDFRFEGYTDIEKIEMHEKKVLETSCRWALRRLVSRISWSMGIFTTKRAIL